MHNKDKKVWLSASGIKCLETCSMMFYRQFLQRIPQKTNTGALRGSLIHEIFELLLKPRHKKHFDYIIKYESIEGSKAIVKLVNKLLIKYNINDEINYELINKMILVGLKNDFFGESLGKNVKVNEKEYRFELENINPEYRIRGYIDKLFDNNKEIKIVDYKSSKQKFQGDELNGNIQSFTYALAAYKLLGAESVTTEFLFLQFPKQPIQEVKPTKEQLKGFEEYLGYVYLEVQNFDEKKAESNMAVYNKDKNWLCKRGSWECPYLKGFKYYSAINPDGSTARTDLNKENIKLTDGQKIKEMYCEPCPGHNNSENDL